MALEAVEAVNRAEEQAREIIAAAQAEVKTLLSDAERAGRERLDAAHGQARDETRRTLDAAQAKGDAAGAAALERAKGEAAALTADAKARMESAAAEIVAKVRGGERG